MSSLFLRPSILFYFIPFIGGLLYSMGFPMNGLPYFMGYSFIGILFLFISLSLPYPKENHQAEDPYKRGLLKKLITGLLFCLGHCLSGYYWIPYTLNEFGQIPFPLNTLLGMLFSLIIMPQVLIFIIILHFWGKLNIKSSKIAGHVHTRNVILALIFVLLDRFIPQQFPAHIGHTWLQLAPNLPLAPIFGVPAFSFMSYWFILSLTSFWRVQKWDYLGIFCFVTFLIINLTIPLKWNPNEDQSPTRLRLVQANVGNFMKLQSENGDERTISDIYNIYTRLSSAAMEKPVDLIIWPETAYPQLLNTALMRMNPDFVPRLISKTAINTKAQLFFGGYDKSKEENGNYYETEYNAAFLMNKDGKLNDVYHKQLLIPFGEGLPFGPLNPVLAKIIKNISYFARGNRFTTFTLDNKKTFISAICYEILFSSFIRDYLNENSEKPNFLINLTNDSWYGLTSEPFQHQFLSHWRALEFNIPIVRMTNTGITSILYPDGSESQRLELFKEEALDIDLHSPTSEKTLWQRGGYLNFLLLALICFIMAIGFEKFKDSKN